MVTNERIRTIRQMEKQYHDECYEQMTLFQEGTWLQKPVKTVMELFDRLDPAGELRVLDLGCGIGRNSIPLAQRLQGTEGKVVCVDLLESAITNLAQYGEHYGVSDKLELKLSDISEFSIAPLDYDCIVAVSTLEHLDSKATFERVLADMVAGTRAQGVNALIISSNIRETDAETGEPLDPMFELCFETEELVSMLAASYEGWHAVKHTVRPYEIEIDRSGRRVMLSSDVVTWAVQKQ